MAILQGALLIGGIVVGLIVEAFGDFSPDVDSLSIVLAAIGWLGAFTAYFATFWSLTGQTPGMRVLGIRVTTITGERLIPRRSVLRVAAMLAAAIPFFAGDPADPDRRQAPGPSRFDRAHGRPLRGLSELLREELERLAGLRLLLAAEADAALAEVGPRLGTTWNVSDGAHLVESSSTRELSGYSHSSATSLRSNSAGENFSFRTKIGPSIERSSSPTPSGACSA